MLNFKCKACECTEYMVTKDSRKKCKDCGKIARKSMADIKAKRQFHSELNIKPEDFAKKEDLEDRVIIIYDVSDERKSRKSKYKNSTSRLILFSYLEDENKKWIGWISNGPVIDEICKDLLESKELPSKEGIEACYNKIVGDENNYWTLWSEDDEE